MLAIGVLLLGRAVIDKSVCWRTEGRRLSFEEICAFLLCDVNN